ncbi:hypothetical protein LCGC14_1320590 [marine sediment metagenome]|uniref:Uncharacterized protein n=1 Tax=marine sediment metagenome TaxID=412755 RepID=A0A0F9NM05_9ZZZZ
MFSQVGEVIENIPDVDLDLRDLNLFIIIRTILGDK